MQITTRASAGPDTFTAGPLATTEQDSCTPPGLPPTDLSPDKLASLLPKPGGTPPDPTIPRKPRWGG